MPDDTDRDEGDPDRPEETAATLSARIRQNLTSLIQRIIRNALGVGTADDLADEAIDRLVEAYLDTITLPTSTSNSVINPLAQQIATQLLPQARIEIRGMPTGAGNGPTAPTTPPASGPGGGAAGAGNQPPSAASQAIIDFIQANMGAALGDANYNPSFDLNSDNVIDGRDYSLALTGQTVPAPNPPRSGGDQGSGTVGGTSGTADSDPYAQFKSQFQAAFGRAITQDELNNDAFLQGLDLALQYNLPGARVQSWDAKALAKWDNQHLEELIKLNPQVLGGFGVDRLVQFSQSFISSVIQPFLEANAPDIWAQLKAAIAATPPTTTPPTTTPPTTTPPTGLGIRPLAEIWPDGTALDWTKFRPEEIEYYFNFLGPTSNQESQKAASALTVRGAYGDRVGTQTPLGRYLATLPEDLYRALELVGQAGGNWTQNPQASAQAPIAAMQAGSTSPFANLDAARAFFGNVLPNLAGWNPTSSPNVSLGHGQFFENTDDPLEAYNFIRSALRGVLSPSVLSTYGTEDFYDRAMNQYRNLGPSAGSPLAYWARLFGFGS